MDTSEGTSWQERLYESEASHLLLYGRALGLGHAEAEDLLQETFLALTRLEAPPVEPRFYALRSYRNRALNYKRSLWRRLRREMESQRWFERGDGETWQERLAMRCLAQLPPQQREVIVLKIWHGYTFDAIGTVLGISPNTAAGRYRYGILKLKACLHGEDYEQLESTRETAPFLETATTSSPS